MSTSSASPKPIAIYVDADACPVKQEVYRVAERHARKGVALKVFVVSNSPIAVPRDLFVGGPPDAKPGTTFAGGPMIERVVVGTGMDEADNWIAERAGRGDIVITADVPLASRCVKAGAAVIAPNGRLFTAELDRHDAGDTQPDGFAAQRRRDYRRPETILGARSFRFPCGAGSGDRPAQARWIRACDRWRRIIEQTIESNSWLSIRSCVLNSFGSLLAQSGPIHLTNAHQQPRHKAPPRAGRLDPRTRRRLASRFKNPRSRATVVLPHPKKDLGRGLVRNIYKQAGWQPD